MTLDELDKLAAEKVMGWQSLGEHWSTGSKHEDRVHKKEVWHPTRNIAQAWELLEKCQYASLKFYGENWRVYINDVGNCVVAETAPLAIVLACLKAVGVEVE